MRQRATVAGVVLTLCMTSGIHAASGDVYAEIMASPLMGTSWLSPGHAFICISYHLASAIKEECYGFYRKPAGGAAFVGAPALADEFKQDPKRFSKITWSIKRKVTQQQLQAFQKLVSSVNVGSYALFENNCADFVSDAVNALGWTNVNKGLLPEPYVRELFAANIRRFVHPAGRFERSGSNWVEYHNSVTYTFTFAQQKVDELHIYAVDVSRGIRLRLPLRGGMSQISQGSTWQNLYSVQPLVE